MCDFCANKCNFCKHIDDQYDISDPWEDPAPIMVDYCNKQANECEDFATDWKYCPMCGKEITYGRS